MLHLLVAPFLLWTAQAVVPQDFVARAAATCNRDDSFRQVFGTNIPGRSASGAAACTSYVQKTVSPCAVTKTDTATVSTTVATNTVTITATTTSTSAYTAITATITNTATSSITTTVTPVTTVTSTETDTETDTTTTTITFTVSPFAKRDLEARATAACPATLSAASTSTPAYASSCTGTRFSSVCSCNGIFPTATTITVTPTSTVTTTSTNSITASVTVSMTKTITSAVTTTPTGTITATVTTTLTETAPQITTATTTKTTTTTTTTATTTVTATSIPGCTSGLQCYQREEFQIFCGNSGNTEILIKLPSTNSYTECAQLCAGEGSCFSFVYDSVTQMCYEYNIQGTEGAPDPNKVYGRYTEGFCISYD